MTTFRCAAARRERGDDLAGTASTYRSFLLVEHAGPWGVDALRDARLPPGVGARLAEAGRRHQVRVLLVRRPGRRGIEGVVRVFAARAAGRDSWLETTLVEDVEDVLDIDMAALGAGRSPGLRPHPGPVLAVCTHGRHDACCAELGRPVALALAATSHADDVWETSHVGGDRFAGNLVVLPRGLYYGDLDPRSAALVADATARGQLVLDHLRGRSDLPMGAQAAEIALRREHGLLGLDEVHAVAVRNDRDLTTARFDVRNRAPVEVVVRRVLGDRPARLTCAAVRDNPVPSYDLVEIRDVT